MHFDVVLDEKDSEKALHYAKHWLNSIGEAEASVEQENCLFCHSTDAPAELRKQIDTQGYAIYKLEGCPKWKCGLINCSRFKTIITADRNSINENNKQTTE